MIRKSLPLLFALYFSASLIMAQPSTGGPDIFGYTYRNDSAANGPTYQWFDISTIGTAVTGLSDDNFVGPYTISGFSYYTTTPTSLYIGSNGYISFVPVNISSSAAQFPAIPTPGGPNNFIAPFLTDLTFGGASSNPAQCFFYNQGDTIAITWEGVPFWTNNTNQYAGDNSFQVILNKADSSITFNYKKQTGLPDPAYTTNYLSIGIEDATGNDGLQYYRGTTFPSDSSSVKFYYPVVVAPITDLAINWVNNDENGGVFRMVGQSDTARLNVKNEGNQAVSSSITVGYQLISSTGLIIDNANTTVNGLAVGSDTTIVFNRALPLGVPNRYELRGYVAPVINDNTRINDSLSIRLTALDTATFTQTLDYTDTIGPFFAISWIGGNGGVAAYFEPPYYPARILSTNFYITGTGTSNGFHSVLYDNSGRQGAFGNVLDSAFIPTSTIITQSYTRNPISNLTVASGGLYLLWLMDGPNIGLGRSFQSPASQRTYEVLGGAWSRYRDADDEDFAMGIDIAPVSTGLQNGISSMKNFKVYPNPAVEQVTIVLDAPLERRDYQLMDLNGRDVEAKILTFDKELKLFRGNLKAGVYLIRVGKSIAKVQFVD